MKIDDRLMVFSLTACTAYTLAYYFDWPLFQYYVAENRFHFSVQPESSGPPILWYGWLATAALAGTACASVLPQRLVSRLLPDLVWLIGCVLIVAALIYEARWFV
jgi:hypothetical protein